MRNFTYTELNTGRQATLVSAPTNRRGIYRPPTLNSTPILAHSRHPTSRRRPDSKLFFKPLFRKNGEERLRASPSQPYPREELLRGLRRTPHPALLTTAGEGRAPHTGSASCAPSSRPAAGYLPWTAGRRAAAASTWPQVFARLLRRPQPAPPRPAPSPALHHPCLTPSPQPRGQQRRSPPSCQERRPLSTSGRNDQLLTEHYPGDHHMETCPILQPDLLGSAHVPLKYHREETHSLKS
ncbi:uncharacterized protein LOC134479801 [Rattus norvegicus]|uniref:uncharacterized protein LOC134479801 n=1 Tax=Rattus norvegicus TaxID=10116 RepID=UPI002FD7D7AA